MLYLPFLFEQTASSSLYFMILQPINYFINLGITPATHKADANRIRLTNIIAILPLLPYAFALVYCIIYNYPRIVFTSGIAIVSIITVLALNYFRRYAFAKSLLICANSAILVVFYKLMADEVSMFFFYFPTIISFIVFYRPGQERKYLWGTAFFVAFCMALCMFLPNQLFAPFPLPVSIHRFIYLFSATVSTLLTAFYIYIIFRVSLRNERILKKAKEDAEAASKEKAIFLSNMSHELRTPLNGIIGTTHILKSEEHLPLQQQHLTVLNNLSEHMMSLVNNVLDYSKIESGRLELNYHRFGIEELMKKLEITFSNSFSDKNIAYKQDLDDRLKQVLVYGDELRLQQVFNNLISNALKFTPQGSVTVNATLIKQTPGYVSVFFSVADTGIGIDAGQLEKIFESFRQGDSATTRKYGGTGLGLSIASSLVKLLEGTLCVKSEKGKGSHFYFTIHLPIYQNQDNVADGAPAVSMNQLKKIKILLAEDNPVNMMVAKKILERWGVQVTEAVNGKIALDKCKAQLFDLLLIDLEMPEMDGRHAIKEIKKINKNIPCIAFTAAVYENMKQDLLHHGFDDYLLKPFKPEDLYQKIISHVRGSISQS
jgi:signal transduction histidine kinase/ActR/RegA family two-component response regulator